MSALQPESDREAIIAVASTYLDAALSKQDPDGPLLAANVRRWTQQNHSEPPRNTSAEQIRQGIRSGDEDGIQSITNRRWIVEGDQAVVIADIWFEGLERPITLYERFRVENGLITEIESIYLRPDS